MIQQRGLNRHLRTRMEQLDFSAYVLRAQVHVDRMVHHNLPDPEHTREETRHSPKLILAPVLVWMVMTLGAIEAASEEDPHFLRHHFSRRSNLVVREKVARGRLVTLGRYPLARDFIVWAIRLDVPADPFPIALGELRVQRVGKD